MSIKKIEVILKKKIMIWLFKIDEVFWNNQPEVSEFYIENNRKL